MGLEQLRKLLEDVAKQMRGLLKACEVDGETRDFNEIEKEEWDKLEKRSKQLEEMIERAERAEGVAAKARDLDQVTSEPPRIQVVREDKHNENGEYRGYSAGNRGGLGECIRDVIAHGRGAGMSEKLEGLQKSTRAALGANSSVGSEGGFLLQTDHIEMLETQQLAANDIVSDCRVIKTSKSSVSISLFDETSRATGSRFGGIQVYRRKEAGSVTASQAKYRVEDLKVEAIEGVTYLTEEMLDDVPMLESWLPSAFASEMGWKLGDEIIGGTGAGECLGILNSAALITVAKESGQAADTVVFKNVDNMIDLMPIASRATAKFYAHANVKQQLRNAVFTPGSLTDFAPFLVGGTAINPQTDLAYGVPVKYIEQARALGDLGDLIYADLKQYLLVFRTGIKAAESIHVQFLTSQKALKFTQRVIGQPIPNSPITDAYGSTQRSPFITLAARA